jgi:hypothetical protein
VETENQIKQELFRDKALIDDKELPIHDYNYAALVDRLKKQGIQVSTTTVIKRAKALKCYKPKKKRKAHDQEVLTNSISDLIQHDASLHKWSPYATEKWILITSIDDYSRMPEVFTSGKLHSGDNSECQNWTGSTDCVSGWTTPII